MAATLVLGALIYLGGWLAHDSRTLPGGAGAGWMGAPVWLRLLLRRGTGRLMAFPLLLQALGIVYLARFLALAGAIPLDPFDSLTRQAIPVVIFGVGGAGLWLLWRDKSIAR